MRASGVCPKAIEMPLRVVRTQTPKLIGDSTPERFWLKHHDCQHVKYVSKRRGAISGNLRTKGLLALFLFDRVFPLAPGCLVESGHQVRLVRVSVVDSCSVSANTTWTGNEFGFVALVEIPVPANHRIAIVRVAS